MVVTSQAVAKPDREAAGKPVEKLPAPLAILRSQLEERAAEFAMVLPAHIKPDKLQRTILTAVQSSPVLLDCERRTFLTACMKAAQDGLLPDGREAAIVPFWHNYKDDGGWHKIRIAQYMPMVWGLRKKILQSGEVTDIFAAVVFKQEIDAGRFVYEEGTERTLRHKPILDPDFIPTDDDVALAYSVATYANGDKSFEVLKRWEIDQIRESSQTGAAFDAKGNPREAKGPWVEWFAEMAKKSVIRRHSKSLPMSGDILADVEAEDLAFAAKSAVALLDSRAPAAPEPVTEVNERRVDSEDQGFDPATGEILDSGPGPDPDPDPADNRPHVQPDSGPDSFLPADADPPAEAVAAAIEAAPVQPDPEGVVTAGEASEAAFQKALADSFVARANHCELLLDLRRLEAEADSSLAQMPDDLTGLVDEAFARARMRLTEKAAAVDTTGAPG